MRPDDPIYDPAELAALYAAGALPTEDAEDVEARLDAGDRLLGAEIASYAALALALADGLEAVAPAPGVKRALLGKIPGPGAGGGPDRPRPRHDRAPGAPAEILIRRSGLGDWRETGIPGVRERVLYHDPARNILTRLLRVDPGMKIPAHIHKGAEECYVLEGDLQSFGSTFHPGDYMRAPSRSRHTVSYSEHGCLLLLSTAPDPLPPR
jgi:anti-sigma factor ChrR (cupin superfamily)